MICSLGLSTSAPSAAQWDRRGRGRHDQISCADDCLRTRRYQPHRGFQSEVGVTRQGDNRTLSGQNNASAQPQGVRLGAEAGTESRGQRVGNSPPRIGDIVGEDCRDKPKRLV